MESDIPEKSPPLGLATPTSGRRGHWNSLLIISAVTFTVYANSLRGPFVFDDLHNIQHNTDLHLRTFDGIDLRRALFCGPSSNRPVAKLTFALNYYFHQLHIAGYHLANVAIHAINACLVYVLTILVSRELHRSHSDAGGNQHENDKLHMVALAVALVFAVHPLQTQAVTYTVQRMASLASIFYLMALIAYIRARGTHGKWSVTWWFGVVACWALALGTKENTVTLPAAIGLYEWCIGSRFGPVIRRRNAVWATGAAVASIMAVVILVFVYMGTAHPLQDLLNRYEYRDFGMWQRVLTQFRVVIFYMTLVAFPLPHRLNLVHWVETSGGWLDPVTTVMSAFTLFGLMSFAVLLLRRHPIAAFGLLFVVLHLAVESSIVNLEMIFEHRMYLPMAGVAIGLAGIALDFGLTTRAMKLAIIPLVLLLGYWTMDRNLVWRDAITLWTDVIEKNAHHARPVYNRGHAFQQADKFALAEQDYLEAIRRESYMEAYTNLANMYVESGRFEDGISLLGQAIATQPQLAVLYNNRGGIYLRRGEHELAKRDFDQALAWSPKYAMPNYNRGRLLAEQGEHDNALAEYAVAIEKDARFFEAFVNRANTYFRQEHFNDAILDYDRAAALRPANPTVAFYRGLCRLRLGEYSGAVEELQRTLQLNRDFIEAYDHLAWIKATCPEARFRDGERAVLLAQTACRLSSGKNYRHRSTLAAAFAESGRFEEAVQEQSAALELAPQGERAALRHQLQQYARRQPYRDNK